ncbi:Tail assembly protein I from prophage [Escherichia coli]|uniref:Tail assembly protein I from prophage n=1 Tax=Escherichia coli TaxID=562 RepID=A0A376UER3_ECOLX|nr:Tail assembly protein I from prophage [Escherichia coli]
MKTGAEAIRALATQLPVFRQKLNEGWYQVRIAGRDAGETNYLPVLMSRWQMVP